MKPESNILFIQLCPRWGDRFKAAKHPVAYLKKTLYHIEGDRVRYEAKRNATRKPPPKPAQNPQDDRPTLSDDKAREAIADLRNRGHPPEVDEDAENPEVKYV